LEVFVLIHKILKRVSVLCALALVLTAVTPYLTAQTNTAAVAGTVLDQAGQLLPNATVTIKNEATGAIRTAMTGRDGHFKADGVPTGFYTISVSAAGFETSNKTEVEVALGKSDDLSISLAVGSVSQSVEVRATASLAAHTAPSQGSLEAQSALSLISPHFIQNFVSPVGDYSDMVQMAPATFSVSANGPGLGDTKIFFRGFKDGFYNMTFDGLPFNDTNDPTHHSWVFFPGPFIGSTLFDRSPGDATAIGPANSGGSINLLSKDLLPDPLLHGTVSYGSWNTRLLELDFDSGPFGGKAKKSNLLLDMHQLNSDGYQTYNYLTRWGGDAKYQYRISDKTIVTAYTGIIDLASNAPNVKGPTRGDVGLFGVNYLLNNDPTNPLYYKYSWYQIPTDFDYIGINSDLGGGWRFEDKVYTDRYYNHQQYNGSTVTAISGTDKLNSYRKFGNSAELVNESRLGEFRAGFWYELANTDRFQTPTSPLTWIDAATPNFHEKFTTKSAQPYAQYAYNLTRRLTFTAGFKVSNYSMHLNQYADNGKTVGCLGGVLSTDPLTKAVICSGGASFITHDGIYHSFQPTGSLRYRVRNNWTAYAQYATGNVIPPSSVFDVKNAAVLTTPKPTQTKTFQFGSVLKLQRFTLDSDVFFIKAQGPYASAPDPVTGEPVYYLSSNTLSKGFEAEGNIVVGHGFNVYLNGTLLSAKYKGSDLWVASSPHDTETVGIAYLHKNWDIGLFNKRIGRMYNDNGSINQAVPIDPFYINNIYFNYTMKEASHWRGTKFRLAVNNLANSHSIIGVAPASTKSNLPAAGDTLTLMAGRSISGTVIFGFAPRR
jgi:iron complex outermembrane receptor protein